jgi:hypothetical protein
VLEVHCGGRRRKDAEENIARCARLRILEYFMFDARRVVLRGWRLESPTDRQYTRIIPQNGRWPVRSLGMELGLRDGQPRWYDGVGIVPLTRELNAELSLSLNDALERAQQAEAERDEAEAERAEAEARAAAAEAEITRLRAELERLRGG